MRMRFSYSQCSILEISALKNHVICLEWLHVGGAMLSVHILGEVHACILST